MPCEYNDCGWCYAPLTEETTAVNGACNDMPNCPQSTSWSWESITNDPPKLLKFQDNGDDTEEHW